MGKNQLSRVILESCYRKNYDRIPFIEATGHTNLLEFHKIMKQSRLVSLDPSSSEINFSSKIRIDLT